MKKFLLTNFIFFSVIILIFLIGVFLPVTPKASNYYLFSKTKKDSMLQHVKSPRIIFIGGSNIVYGLNSELIKDSLRINPINAGVTATVGLVFMMENTLQYIQKGDIVVIIPEYQQFYNEFAYGGDDLVRLLFDVDRAGFDKLRKKQWIGILKNCPNYFVSKFDPREYFNINLNPVYGLDIFNEYGDSNKHWGMEKKKFSPSNYFTGDFNYTVIEELKSFRDKLWQKQAILFVTFPGYQAKSFDINHEQIFRIDKELKKEQFILLGYPERYKMRDSLMFDTPYHLIKEGVDLRTNLIIEDIRKTDLLNID